MAKKPCFALYLLDQDEGPSAKAESLVHPYDDEIELVFAEDHFAVYETAPGSKAPALPPPPTWMTGLPILVDVAQRKAYRGAAACRMLQRRYEQVASFFPPPPPPAEAEDGEDGRRTFAFGDGYESHGVGGRTPITVSRPSPEEIERRKREVAVCDRKKVGGITEADIERLRQERESLFDGCDVTSV